jgi:hypothetical protein
MQLAASISLCGQGAELIIGTNNCYPQDTEIATASFMKIAFTVPLPAPIYWQTRRQHWRLSAVDIVSERPGNYGDTPSFTSMRSLVHLRSKMQPVESKW